LGGGLRVADVSTPEAPVELGAYPGIDAWRVLVDGDLAYVVEAIPNLPYHFWILDVSDPGAIAPVGDLAIPTLTWWLEKTGDIVYLASDDEGVRIVDVSDPTNPTEVGWLNHNDIKELQVRGDLLYITSFSSFSGGLIIYDIGDPVNPAFLSFTSETGVAPWHLHVEGDYAYVSDFEYLRLYLVSDSTAPVDLGDYTMPGDFFGLTGRDELVLVSDGNAGLQLVENLHFGDPGGGLSWELLDSGSVADLHGVSFPNALQGWVAGTGGTVLHTADGGDSWQAQSSGVGLDLFDVAFVDASTGWVAGQGGVIRKTTNGGASWLPQASGSGQNLYALSFVNEQTGWAVGGGGTILHTANGGATWQHQASPTSIQLSDVDFVDAQHGWIAGGSYGEILMTTNGGLTWTLRNTGSSALLFAIDFVDTETGWVVGMFNEIRKSTNGGITWFAQEGALPNDWLYDIDFVDVLTGWCVGFDGKIQATGDGGELWETQLSGTPAELRGVDFVDASTGFAVGDLGTILRATGGITAAPPTADGDAPAAAAQLASHPNPFNPQTTLRYVLAEAGPVILEIFDTRGRRVRTLVDGQRAAGAHEVQWQGRDERGRELPSGVYFAVVQSSNGRQSQKLVLLR
jgi:photosystem II stability/assembly factor-like uncharacterized protein